MKSFIAFLIYSFLVLNVNAQQQSNKISWYKCMTGIVHKASVTMYLHRAGNRVYGYYYFNNLIQPQFVSGTATANRITVDKFEGFLGKNIFKGFYRLNPHARQVAFQLFETTNPSLNNFDFNYIESEKTRIIGLGQKVGYFAASIWPKNSVTPGKQFYLKTVISEQFNIRQFTDKLSTIFENRKELFLTSGKEKEAPGNNNVNEQIVLVAYQDKNILSLANLTHNYTTDTGSYNTIAYSAIDLVHQKTIPLIDVLGTEGIDKLPPLLQKYLRIKYSSAPIANLSGLFDSDIQPNDNFYITPSGICFSYLPGELSISSIGQIDIFIPFTELRSYLTPLIIALIK